MSKAKVYMSVSKMAENTLKMEEVLDGTGGPITSPENIGKVKWL